MVQQVRFFVSKTFEFLFRKMSCSLTVAILEFQKYWKKWFSIFVKSLKNKHEHELFHRYFSVFFFFFLLFRSIYLKEHLLVAASIYFNRDASQKCKNATLQTNLRGVLISWRKYLFNSKYVLLNKYWRSSYFPVNDYWAVIITPALMLRTA